MIVNLSKYSAEDIAMTNPETGENRTYGELLLKVNNIATGLQRYGLQEGQYVAIISSNCIEYAEVILGIWLARGVVTTVNPIYTKNEIKEQLQRLDVRFVFANLLGSKNLDTVIKEINPAHKIRTILLGSGSWGNLRIETLEDASKGAVHAGVTLKPYSATALADTRRLPALVIFSSGTSGVPKGVVLSHYNVIASIFQNSHPHFNGKTNIREVIVCLPPFFHCYGLLFILMHGIYNGQRMIVVPRFVPEQYLTAIEKYKATYLPVAPPLITFLLKNPLVAKYDLSSLTSVLSGAAPLTVGVSNEFTQKFPRIMLRQGYGLTELSLSHMSPRDGSKLGAIGITIPSTESKIVDPETGLERKTGEHGEMWIRGPQVMIGYLGNRKATEDILTKDRWLKTGDIGYVDEEGHFFIVDRLKEIIKYNGYQVSPSWLEGLLTCHPKIQDAAVIGIPAGTSGYLPKAFIVRKSGSNVTASEIVKYVKDNAVNYKQLRGGVTFIDEIPKSVTGKILRRFLLKQSKL